MFNWKWISLWKQNVWFLLIFIIITTCDYQDGGEKLKAIENETKVYIHER